MAAELTTTKLNADSHLLLDQSLLRLPHELVRRNFKASQRYVEREKDYILPTLKDTANASLSSTQAPEQTLASLDAMISRMQTLKRKLQTLQEEEETIQSHSSKRIRHLQDLYEVPSLADVKYDDWSRTRLDRLMVDYLLRAGYSSSAAALAKEKQITNLVDLDVFVSCHKIASSLLRGDTKDALTWCNENRAALKKIPPAQLPHNLEFELRLQQYIELIRMGTTPKKIEAIQHSQKFLVPHSATRSEAIMSASGLLSYCPPEQWASDPSFDPQENPNDQPHTTPYDSLLSSTRWSTLSTLFITTHHTLLGLPTRPLLHVALSAGLSALKTPACHSRFNPGSAATPGHTPLAFTSASNTSLCPICSTELNELARNVPYAHHTKSYVEPDPIVLPNGRIYGRGRLEELQRKLVGGVGQVGQDEVRDPTTGEVYAWEEVSKVYIS